MFFCAVSGGGSRRRHIRAEGAQAKPAAGIPKCFCVFYTFFEIIFTYFCDIVAIIFVLCYNIHEIP